MKIGVSILIILLCSCKILKGKSSEQHNTTAATRIDSGTVKRTETTTDKAREYEKTTIIYPPRDTTINKSYIYPSTVIYEKGKEQENTSQNEFQALWLARLDTIAQRSRVHEKTKETSYNGLAIGGGLAFAGLLIASAIFLKRK